MTKFDAWFHELEHFGLRSERLFYDLDCDAKKFEIVKEWLKAAYLVGKEESDQIIHYE